MFDEPARFKGSAVGDRCNSETKLHQWKTDGETYGFSCAFDISLPHFSAVRSVYSNLDAIRRRCSPRTQEDTT